MKLLRNVTRLPLGVVLAILIIGAGWARADGPAPDCYILSAGVDNYPKVHKLEGCLNDARNTTNAFAAQKGKMFANVYGNTLLDGQATWANITNNLKNFAGVGKAGDFYVIFLSGHGGRYSNNQQWYFLPYDNDPANNKADLTGQQILNASDVLVRQGKKVVVIIDACFSGALTGEAQNCFKNYTNPNGGGLILMLSSSGAQTSNALGRYSAFAKAFVDGMTAADANHDGRITLQELRTYTYSHTYELLRQSNNNNKQDCEMAWSPSISPNMPLALLQPRPTTATVSLPPAQPPRPQAPQSVLFMGSENLANFGPLSFQMFSGGRAVMIDAHQTTEGTWQQNGNQVVLQFNGGRVVYRGALANGGIIGIATNGQTAWTWNVTRSNG